MLYNNDDNWFVLLKQANALPSIRLFCFHHSGGSASTYQKWANGLLNNVELIAVQLPGRETRFEEPLLYDISQAVDTICSKLYPYLDEPFVLFGHSMGALIAFEIAKILQKRKITQLKHLIVSGCQAPQVPLTREPINNLTDTEIIEKLKEYNGIPKSIIENKDIISLFLPIIRADFYMTENYKYNDTEPLTCKLTALGGLNDYTFDPNNLLKWKTQTNCSFTSHFLPGDHFFVQSAYKDVIRMVNNILYREATGSP